MADGVVDIPLPGRRLDSGREEGRSAPACHFLAGPENRLVEVAIRSVLDESPEPQLDRDSSDETDRQLDAPLTAHRLTIYSPLVLYGPSGVGKSHIAHGLAAVWKARGRRQRVVTTTAVDFARELADAIESQAVDEFRTKYRTANLLVFEDLGMLATRKSGKLNAQEEFVRTLDALSAEEHWVVVTASAAPNELPGLLASLRSRLTAGLAIPLAPPGPEARSAVLRKLAALKEMRLPQRVADALAEGLSGTVPELAGALAQLAGRSESSGAPIDVSAVRTYLAQRNRRQQPSVHDIALATARHFSLRLSDLKSPVRRRALVNARGVAVYLARHGAAQACKRSVATSAAATTRPCYTVAARRKSWPRATLRFMRPSNNCRRTCGKSEGATLTTLPACGIYQQY